MSDFKALPIRKTLDRIARHSAIVFVSTLSVQLSTFAILAIGGALLPVPEFARLSIIIATATIATLAFDFGLNVTMIKRYGETQNEAYLFAPNALRLLILPASAVAGFALTLLAGAGDVGLGVFMGGALNLWAGARATNQARQDYNEFAKESFLFSAVRIIAGIWAIAAAPNAIIVAFAAYAAPVFTVTLPSLLRSARKSFAAIQLPTAHSAGYAAQIYVNQIAFSSLPYIPQYFIEARLPDSDVARYGLALAFLGPVLLAINSVRSTLLPRFVIPGAPLETLLWSRKGLLALVALGACMSLLAVVAATAVETVYHARYPGLAVPLLILLLATTATGIIGFYGLSVHTQNKPHLLVAINLARLAILVALLVAIGHSLIIIALSTAIVMVAGEIALALLLLLLRRP